MGASRTSGLSTKKKRERRSNSSTGARKRGNISFWSVEKKKNCHSAENASGAAGRRVGPDIERT